ncbi:hypothetical protein SARC_07363 [Sphaeroforma arctica JP610]|uniref:Pectate lyase n=1 Tax=Sphaeroforma arctica JP610 TaxID=667725 RepID=A0A0L0FUE0_9EUKA|nr:hypothetical protein SARC_07363 [Sphaeroforma arctica JP610]KNC80269.1 hypothetical protein SARC_07363 [Sphaeroforma arctica JP610]|eukprot:XP_014154171.1 hypothetical protein SARC_07363 [Sphaeroforma arctica JP610]
MTVQFLIWSIFLHATFALAAPSPTLTPTDVADTALYYNQLINALLALQSSEVSGGSNPSSAFSTFVSVSTAASVTEPSTGTYIPIQTNTPATAEKALIIATSAISEITAPVATNVAVTIGDDESAMDLIALSGSCALCLNGAWWNDICYDNLEDAVHKSSADGVITVRGKINVDEEITIDRDTNIVGENCNGSRPIVTLWQIFSKELHS